jgi:hypothetical protein
MKTNRITWETPEPKKGHINLVDKETSHRLTMNQKDGDMTVSVKEGFDRFLDACLNNEDMQLQKRANGEVFGTVAVEKVLKNTKKELHIIMKKDTSRVDADEFIVKVISRKNVKFKVKKDGRVIWRGSESLAELMWNFEFNFVGVFFYLDQMDKKIEMFPDFIPFETGHNKFAVI